MLQVIIGDFVEEQRSLLDQFRKEFSLPNLRAPLLNGSFSLFEKWPTFSRCSFPFWSVYRIQ